MASLVSSMQYVKDERYLRVSAQALQCGKEVICHTKARGDPDLEQACRGLHRPETSCSAWIILGWLRRHRLVPGNSYTLNAQLLQTLLCCTHEPHTQKQLSLTAYMRAKTPVRRAKKSAQERGLCAESSNTAASSPTVSSLPSSSAARGRQCAILAVRSSVLGPEKGFSLRTLAKSCGRPGAGIDGWRALLVDRAGEGAGNAPALRHIEGCIGVWRPCIYAKAKSGCHTANSLLSEMPPDVIIGFRRALVATRRVVGDLRIHGKEKGKINGNGNAVDFWECSESCTPGPAWQP